MKVFMYKYFTNFSLPISIANNKFQIIDFCLLLTIIYVILRFFKITWDILKITSTLASISLLIK